MNKGIIFKAISGFYYVEADGEMIECKARGLFRHNRITPLVGDHVLFSSNGSGKGILEEILPRKNAFVRPPVSNLDQMIIIASQVIPVTDPFLIDRMAAIAGYHGCECIICINKSDLARGNELFDIYSGAGFQTMITSAVTGEGMDALSMAIVGKVSAFTGNSGVGKSSILNTLEPEFHLKTGEVSDKLGRGRHTTRHVELFRLRNGAIVADTPGFSSFDTDRMDIILKTNLPSAFREFAPFIGHCKFSNCSHVKETGCSVLEALHEGKIHPSRHQSYYRLYEQAKRIKEWEQPPTGDN